MESNIERSPQNRPGFPVPIVDQNIRINEINGAIVREDRVRRCRTRTWTLASRQPVERSEHEFKFPSYALSSFLPPRNYRISRLETNRFGQIVPRDVTEPSRPSMRPRGVSRARDCHFRHRKSNFTRF